MPVGISLVLNVGWENMSGLSDHEGWRGHFYICNVTKQDLNNYDI